MSHKKTYTEESILELLRSKSEQGFEALYDNYGMALYGIAFKIVKDKELAEDTLQNSFIKIWRNMDRYDPQKGRLFTWLLNIVRNTAIDALRKNNLSVVDSTQTLSDLGNIADNDNHTLQDIELEQIKIKMQHLAPEHLVLIELAYFEGFTQTEISQKLALPLGTVKSRIRTALKNLIALLK